MLLSNCTPKEIYYFSSTHWDREWYQTYQQFRYRLVKVFSEVLDVLEQSPAFAQFIVDGQAIVLRDFLQICPEELPRVRRLMEAGRLIAGPWLTMPDETLVSGESLIQNLSAGHQTIRQISDTAPVFPVGYVCDIFGHTAQLPQILNGFGIRNAILGRGTNQHNTDTFFLWESPDGSRCAAYKLPETMGYGTFFYDVYDACRREGRDSFSDLVEKAREYVASELGRSNLPLVILMDGMDHTPIHSRAPELLEELGRIYSCPTGFGKMDKLFREVWSNSENLQVKKGELREPDKAMVEHNRLIAGVLTSRYDLKKENDTCQTLLEKCAGPAAALALTAGSSALGKFLAAAWDFLLQNHAHDSICGCSVDEVHRDMHYRFAQSRQIAGEIYGDGFQIFGNLQTGKPPSDKENRLIIFNPLAFPQRKVITVDVWFPVNYSHTFDEMIPSEPVNQFRIYDRGGTELPYQILRIRRRQTVRRPGAFYGDSCDVYTLRISADLPAMGFAAYRIVPSDLPVRFFGSRKTAPLSCENEYLRLSVTARGSVNLTDKRSGTVYTDLLHYQDRSEVGDGWFKHDCYPGSVSHSCQAVAVETVSDGPVSTTFCVTHRMMVPEEVVYHRNYTEASPVRKPLIIRTYLTLNISSACISCRTEVENTVRDHCLSLCLHTGVVSESYLADQAFCFVRRPVRLNETTHDWREPDTAGKAFSSVVCREGNDGIGFAFISAGGMHECAVLPDSDGTMEVTLMRTFSKTFLTDGQPDGQLSGTQIFEYQLCPLSAPADPAGLIRMKDAFRTPLLAITEAGSAADFSASAGFALLEGNAVCSTVRPSESDPDEILIRLVNYSGQNITDTLRCPFEIRSLREVDLLGDTRSDVFPVNDAQFRFTLRPGQIRTYSARISS